MGIAQFNVQTMLNSVFPLEILFRRVYLVCSLSVFHQVVMRKSTWEFNFVFVILEFPSSFINSTLVLMISVLTEICFPLL